MTAEPKVGDEIYCKSIDECEGGLAIIETIAWGVSAGEPARFVTLRGIPGNWNYDLLMPEQPALKALYGMKRARSYSEPNRVRTFGPQIVGWVQDSEENEKLRERIEQLEDELVAAHAALQRMRDRDPQADMAAHASSLAQSLEQAMQSLRHDSSDLFEALTQIKTIIRGRSWVAETRGCYEWDDDKYKEEAGDALREVFEIAQEALIESLKRMHAPLVQGRAALEKYRSIPRQENIEPDPGAPPSPRSAFDDLVDDMCR